MDFPLLQPPLLVLMLLRKPASTADLPPRPCSFAKRENFYATGGGERGGHLKLSMGKFGRCSIELWEAVIIKGMKEHYKALRNSTVALR